MTTPLHDALRAACVDVGIVYRDVPADGRWHSADIDDDPRGRGDGRIKLFADGAGGIVANWKGETRPFFADDGRKLTEAERRERERKRQDAIRQAEEEEIQRHAEAARKAAQICKAALPATDSHPYLAKKAVQAHGLRVYYGDLVIAGMPCDGALVIPMRDGAELHSLQFIAADGDKRFLKGGRVSGCYCPIGKPNGVLCVAEGFATGASIHEATGYAVAVAFNAGNLLPVARAMRKKFSDAKLVVCADDDAGTLGNPGLSEATEAARAVGALLAVPDFGADRPADMTDMNDLARLRGTEAVRRAIAGAIVPASEVHRPRADNATARDPAGAAWPDPKPLPDSLPSVKEFDSALLPDSLRPWIVDIAERVQCAPDFPAVGALVSLAAVVGRKISIRPKRRDDWLEVPNLWGALVGRPGVLKSPALREAMRPLRRLEAKAADAFKVDAAAWHRAQELSKLRREAERSNLVKEFKKDRNASATLTDDVADDEPQARRYIVNDCSHEALGVILQHNPNGTLAYRDELVGLLKSLDKEGNESAQGFFLTAWSGIEGYTFDRIGRGLNQRIDACCLSLLGSIQPSIIGGYLRQAVEGSGDDGLLSRFQLLVWPDVSSDWRDVDRWPESQARATANETFDRLDGLDSKTIGATIEDGEIPYLRFDLAAQEIFSDWRATLEQRLRSGEDHPAVESHLAKYRKLVPALSLLIHLADLAQNPSAGAVGDVALLKALAWAEYLETHARRAYASVTQAEVEGARALLGRIRRNEVSDAFARRDVYLKHWANLSKPDDVQDAVRLLCDLDWLREEREETGGAPKTVYRINPRARQS